MWSRQCSSRAAAEKEVAEQRAAGHTATDPSWTYGPNGRKVWSYSCDAGLPE